MLYYRWEICQWDVVAAYLQADLQHPVYIADTTKAGETKYWKPHKALYGLKQASHEWYLEYIKLRHILENNYNLTQNIIGDEGSYTSTSKAIPWTG